MTSSNQEQQAIIRYRINQNIENELARLPPSLRTPRPAEQVWAFIRTIRTMNSYLWMKLERQ